MLQMLLPKILPLFLMNLLLLDHVSSKDDSDHNNNDSCVPFDCGQLSGITFPFCKSRPPPNISNSNYTIHDHISTCWSPSFELFCSDAGVRLAMNETRFFKVKELSISERRLLLVDSLLAHSVSKNSCHLPLALDYAQLGYNNLDQLNTYVEFMKQQNSSSRRIFDCDDGDGIYFKYGNVDGKLSSAKISDPYFEVKSIGKFPVLIQSVNRSGHQLVEVIREGFYLSWPDKGCDCGSNTTGGKKYCQSPKRSKCPYKKFVLVILVATIAITVISISMLKLISKRKAKAYEDVEKFLKQYQALMPTRYSCEDIKRITNGLSQRLGQGGSGCVFKGTLPNGDLVAVKVLNKSSDCVDAFINEVAAMSMIHHVNVVRLLGFCSKGHKRALIYEFMPNGSLEKFIYTKGYRADSLSWEKIFEIAIGISRGIWYLHQGCNKRIMHFDIKPHNILLDSNFNPKISDFGLAKSCSKERNTISNMAARGTLGYIAPELFSKSFGPVSCKSDVYSHGMLILEMVGRRKNNEFEVENPSQVYFPAWIFKRLQQEVELGLGEMSESDEKIVKKMAIVGLWCIQMNPAHRPCMNMVVQMLEGALESLQMPPKPFLSPLLPVTEEGSEE